jgi:hypothetical protein
MLTKPSLQLYTAGGPPAPSSLAAQPGLICWPAVAVAAGLALALVAGLIVWLATHPVPRPVDPVPGGENAAAPEATSLTPAVLPRTSEPAAKEDHRAKAHAPAGEARARKKSAVRRSVLPRRGLAPPADQASVEPQKEEPPIAPQSGRPAGETYGTSAVFLSNPAEAARRAGQQDKLLFVQHVSGNFEESCFT